MAGEAFHVLLVDDSPECHMVVRQALKKSNIELSVAGTKAEAEKILRNGHAVDLLLLDIGLPDGDGLSIMADSSLQMPVFLLTGNEHTESKVRAFHLGADDYLTKPVNPAELQARVEMRLKKSRQIAFTPVLEAGNLLVDFQSLRAFLREGVEKQELDLTSKEMKILCALIKSRGQVLSRPQIVKEVWGVKVHVLDRTVDSHISGLRRKLKGSARYIESLPHQGYRFRQEP